MDRDLVCGLIGFAIALVYLGAAAGIPQSSFADSVGAAGVPHILGYALAGVSALFVVQRLVLLRRGRAGLTSPASEVFNTPLAAFASAAGTALICAVFVFVFEAAGYILSIALLILAMCLYQGERLNARLAVVAAGGALVLWILFAVLLGVRMPQGIWADLV
jgi:putative tricarboxylic transport membrane protein